jgi:hypothetical protein
MSKSKKKTEEITRTIDITLSAEKWKIFDVRNGWNVRRILRNEV